MTENEAIERIKDHMEIHKLNEPRVIYITVALSMAITVLKEIYQYREMEQWKNVEKRLNSRNILMNCMELVLKWRIGILTEI